MGRGARPDQSRGDNGVYGSARVPGPQREPDSHLNRFREVHSTVRETYDAVTGARDQYESYIEYDGISSLATAANRYELLIGAELTARELAILAGFNALVHLWVLGRALYEILEEGLSAMRAGRENQNTLAWSHAYAYWLFSHRQPVKPGLPADILEHYRMLDRTGANGGLTAAERSGDWDNSIRHFRNQYESEFRAIAISTLRQELLSHFPGVDTNWLYRASADELRDTLKLQLCHEFDNQPRLAQTAVLNGAIQNLPDIQARVLVAMNRRNPFELTCRR